MEIFGLSVICSIFSYIGMKFRNMTVDGVIQGVIDAAGGEALEEALETVVELLFPKLNPYLPFTRLGKERRSFTKDVKAALKGLSTQEMRELWEFFKSHEVRGTKVDISDADACKTFFKQMKRQLKESEGALTRSIAFIEGDALIREVYGITDGGETVPAALKKLSDVVTRHVYERMYLGLSSNDRDLAKVVQIMLVENNGRVADTVKNTVKDELRTLLRDPLAIVLQHHEDGTLATLTGRGADGTAPNDPFFYVKLICPDCGACGDNVHRHGDRVFCRCCGGSYNIVENAEPRVVERIDRLEASLLSELEKRLEDTGARVSAQMRGRLREMAEQMVSAECFEVRMNALEQSNARTGAAVTQSITDSREQLQEWLNERLKGVTAYLEQMREQGESDAQSVYDRMDGLQQGLSAVLQSESRAVQAQLASIQSGIDTLGAQSTEMLGMMRYMARLGQLGIKLDEASMRAICEMLKSSLDAAKKGDERPSRPTPRRAVERTCPTCGNLVDFGNGRELVCPDCGAVLSGRTARIAQNPPVPLEIVARNGGYVIEPCADAGDLNGYDTGVATLALHHTDACNIKHGRVKLSKRIERLSFDRVILRPDSACALGVNAKGVADVLSAVLAVLGASSRNLGTLVLGANASVSADSFHDWAYREWKRVSQNVFKSN